MGYAIFDPTRVYDALDGNTAKVDGSPPEYQAGSEITDASGNTWRFVRYTSAATAGQFVVVNRDGSAAPVNTSNDAFGKKAGVVGATAAAGQSGWVQRDGVSSFLVRANCAAGVELNTTTTAGYLDDDGGGVAVVGAALTAARGGTNGLADGVLNWVRIGA